MIIFATKNKDKLKEIQKIIPNVVDMETAGYGHIETIEDGKTYKDNAAKKAYAVMMASGKPVMADDSGIEIAHYKGLPGVNTADWKGGNTRARERNLEILSEMATAEDRRALYTCTIALFLPNKSSDCKTVTEDWEAYEHYFTTGSVSGEIAMTPMGDHGFAYDEIMYVKKCEKTMGEMTLDEKNVISHRNKALQKMKSLIKELELAL